MSAWRREGIAAFPELRAQLNDADEIFSPYALWFELLPMVREAHRAGDDDLLRRIYDYAEWSSRQDSNLQNAVAVSFYEHLFDERWMRPLVGRWLNPRVVAEIRPLWAARLAPEEMHEVEALLQG